MAGEWQTGTVGDVALRVTKGTTPTTIGGQFVEKGINFVKVESITADGRIDTRKLTFIDDFTNDLLSRSVLSRNDILFTIAGTIGKVALVPEGILPANTNQAVAIVRPNPEKVSPRYLYYVLGDESRVRQAQTRVVQSVQANFSLGELSSLEIPLPPLNEQKTIAHILGTLDDKIELNRRMNETLEAIARALFKSWFVDFDPVREKVEGRDPGLPKNIANLFPDSFEDSELVEIPTGWKVGKLGDVLAQRVERCIASSETAARPYVPIDCISPRSLFLTESKSGEEAQSSLTKFYKGDLLFGAMRPYFHKVCIAPFDGTTRTTAFVLTPKAKEDFAFATLLLHHPDTIDYATRHSTGSTIPYAVWGGSLEEMPVIVPPSAVRIAFNMTVRPILDRIPVPHFQSKTLATLRDALLPKLISGELRVGDATRFLGDDG